jgi:hypothetical protein
MRRFTILLTLVVAFGSVFAQKSWVSFTSEQPEQAAITILQSDRAGLTFEVTVPGMFSEQVIEGEKTFQRISLIEDMTTKAVGRPELPMLHELIGIPDNLAISVNITNIETVKLSGYNVYPFQTPTTDNPGGHDREFVMDKAFYSKVGNYPNENVIVDQPNIWRDVKVSGIHITPFTYNPATQELEVITSMTIEIEFAGSDNSAQLNRSKELTPKFYNMYQTAISNFGDLGYTETLRDTPGVKYLIITNTEALDAIQPLVDYKNQMGHKVEVKTLEAGFNTPQNFKDYISVLYEEGLEYVLMVGDAYPNGGSGGGPNIVPMYWWAPSGEDASYSDSWYSCLDGPDDHFADLAIGRFVYNNGAITELELQIDKTMTHYLTPDVSDNWAENTILVTHKEQYPGKYTQCCEEIRTFDYSIQTPIFETAYGGESYTNAQVVDFVNNTGAGIFNYRGHGSATQLWDWTNSGPSHFTASDVAQFTNNEQLFVFFDVCCDNMDIVAHSGECLCESFMKHPSGSVAVNGAIIPSYTIPNHDYDKEMYKAVFEEGITNIGYTTNYANLTVLNVHGTIGRSNVRTYLWLGDASIEAWTLQPMDLTVTHDEQIFLGTAEFNVNVVGANGPVENAMVCVSNEDGSVYAVAYTDAAGLAMVTFDEPIQTPGDATVTVTRNNYLPFQASVPVIPQDGPYVVKDSFIINDATGGNGNGMMDYAEAILLSLSVKNVGIYTAEDVMVTLSTEDEYITITDGEENYGDVEPDAVVSVTDGFAFDVAGNIPDGHAVLFDVSASDGTDTWTSNIVITGHAPAIELGDYMISDPTGNNNGKIDPGETVQISVYLNNDGSADAYSVMGELMTNDMYLQVNTTDPQAYGDIAAAGMGMATFEAYADESTPAGHMAQLDFEFTADYDIAGNGNFNTVIGQIPVVIIDLDPNNSSGPAIQEACEELGVAVEYTEVMPADLTLYSSAFVCLGIYSSNTTLSTAQGLALAGLLDAGGALYMEGGDTWYYDDQTAVHDYFNINATSDGSSDLSTINGQAGTFAEGLSFGYSGENNWIDHIEPGAGAEQLFMNSSPSYGCAVAYDEGSYNTIGASFEFGGLNDSDATKTELMEGYLIFFGIIQSGVNANFVASVTDICEGEEVQYTDYSSGGATGWAWEFEGGTPATSTEQNPTVMYEEMGEFDVTLTVTGTAGSNTMTKNNYISTMAMPETPENMAGEEQVCQGNTDVYVVDAVAYASSYVWALDPPEAGTVTENGTECTIVWSDLVEGMATLKVCGINDCGEGPWSEQYEVLVQNCTGIDDNNGEVPLSIYPNPSTGSFTLELNANDKVSVRVMNIVGELVYQTEQMDVNGFFVKTINLNNLSDGVYYLRLEGDTFNKTEKIVISR